HPRSSRSSASTTSIISRATCTPSAERLTIGAAMDFAVPSHLVPTLERIDQLMADRIIPAEKEVMERGWVGAAGLLAELRAAVKAAGLWGPQIPTELGGMGLGLVDHGLVSER